MKSQSTKFSLGFQVEAEQIPILSDKLERSHTEVKDAEVELIRLKAHIEEIERKAQDRIDQLKEAHQQEIDDISNFIN